MPPSASSVAAFFDAALLIDVDGRKRASASAVARATSTGHAASAAVFQSLPRRDAVGRSG